MNFHHSHFLSRLKEIRHWLPSYSFHWIKEILARRCISYPENIYFLIVDHFEPEWLANYEDALAVVDRWCSQLPQMAAKHRDYRGEHPKHNFFIPVEQYHPEITNRLASLSKKGYGTVEIHLHHDNDTPDNLGKTLSNFKKIFHDRHGLLRKNPDTGEIIYAFVHGNWSLDNSRADGRMCGVNNEIDILIETGCYADLTMPSGSGSTQTKTINSIYYAIDDPEKPKSHDTGIPMTVGLYPPENALLMIQGPLALNWKDRKFGLFPSIEGGDISLSNPPNRRRIDLWIKQRIRPKGDDRSIVVKVHTHGANPRNVEPLLHNYLHMIYSYLEKNYNDGEKYRLFYVTPYELYCILKSIEKGS